MVIEEKKEKMMKIELIDWLIVDELSLLKSNVQYSAVLFSFFSTIWSWSLSSSYFHRDVSRREMVLYLFLFTNSIKEKKTIRIQNAHDNCCNYYHQFYFIKEVCEVMFVMWCIADLCEIYESVLIRIISGEFSRI